jgi:hypothetical protein
MREEAHGVRRIFEPGVVRPKQAVLKGAHQPQSHLNTPCHCGNQFSSQQPIYSFLPTNEPKYLARESGFLPWRSNSWAASAALSALLLTVFR